MTQHKPADGAYPLHPLIAERWSPRAFDGRPIARETLGSLFEAARWAPSCFNEQPWRYLYAHKEDAAGFERFASCLVEGNAWAKHAAVLVLTACVPTFARNGQPNRHAWHDVGLATMSLVLQAEALGVVSHQMAGFDAARAKQTLGLPADHEPIAMLALGYRGDPATLPAPLAERERAQRGRRPLSELVHGAGWDRPAGL